MRKLSEVKNGDALELIANTIEPISRILADKEVEVFKAKAKKKELRKIDIAKWVMTAHSEDVLEILAALEGEDIETFEISALEIPMRVLEILNDEEIVSLFTSQGQTITNASSGSAMANIEAEES